MKRYLAVLVVLCSTNAYAGDAEVITTGIRVTEAGGIMQVNGEFKNNTNVDFKDFKAIVDFKIGRRSVCELTIPLGELKAGEQIQTAHRAKSTNQRWAYYDLSFYEGDTPLFWRLPKNKK